MSTNILIRNVLNVVLKLENSFRSSQQLPDKGWEGKKCIGLGLSALDLGLLEEPKGGALDLGLLEEPKGGSKENRRCTACVFSKVIHVLK